MATPMLRSKCLLQAEVCYLWRRGARPDPCRASLCRRDAYVYEGSSFDGCGGHPQIQGEYHYHTGKRGLCACSARPPQAISAPPIYRPIADQMKSGCIYTAAAGKHSPMLGVMADSIPIYGSLGELQNVEGFVRGFWRGCGEGRQRPYSAPALSPATAFITAHRRWWGRPDQLG